MPDPVSATPPAVQPITAQGSGVMGYGDGPYGQGDSRHFLYDSCQINLVAKREYRCFSRQGRPLQVLRQGGTGPRIPDGDLVS